MRRSTLVGLTFLLLVPSPARASDPTGTWWAEGGSAQVEISRCGDALCGHVIWLRSPFDENGCALRDAENPDAALRERGVMGVEMLRGLRASGEGEWSGGRIYDPGSGRTYRAVARMEGPDRLRLRGYLGIRLLGRTATWVRVGSEQQCRQPA